MLLYKKKVKNYWVFRILHLIFAFSFCQFITNRNARSASYGVQLQIETHSPPLSERSEGYCGVLFNQANCLGELKHKMIKKLKEKIKEIKEALYYSETMLGKLYQAWNIWWYSRKMRKEWKKWELERELENKESELWYQEYLEEQRKLELEYLEQERELELEYLAQDQLRYEEWYEEEEKRRDEEERYERYLNGECSKCGEYRFSCRCY